jgi:hypothetical protein
MWKKSQVGRPNLHSKKEKNTTILIVLGVGISLPAAGHHCSMAESRRKWFATSLWTSLSSAMDSWKSCGCEAAVAKEKLASVWNQYNRGDGDHDEGGEKWRRWKERLGLMGRSHFNNGSNEEACNSLLICAWNYGSTVSCNSTVKIFHFHLCAIEEGNRK